MADEADFGEFFIDILGNPDPFIAMLQQSGSTGYRFSLEWAVIEPNQGEIDPKAIELYRTFITKLKEAGIEPYVTLHHFVHPQWLEDRGAFYTPENINLSLCSTLPFDDGDLS